MNNQWAGSGWTVTMAGTNTICGPVAFGFRLPGGYLNSSTYGGGEPVPSVRFWILLKASSSSYRSSQEHWISSVLSNQLNER